MTEDDGIAFRTWSWAQFKMGDGSLVLLVRQCQFSDIDLCSRLRQRGAIVTRRDSATWNVG
jgi:hypothetical protein